MQDTPPSQDPGEQELVIAISAGETAYSRTRMYPQLADDGCDGHDCAVV